MPNLKELLKKKDKIARDTTTTTPQKKNAQLDVPEFTFIRSTSVSHEVIQPPSFPDDEKAPQENKRPREHKHHFPFRHSANAAYTKDPTAFVADNAARPPSRDASPRKSSGEKRLSGRLHFHHRSRSRSSLETSSNLPEGLPAPPDAVVAPLPPSPPEHERPSSREQELEREREITTQREAQWEKRATLLAHSNPLLAESPSSRPGTAGSTRSRSRSPTISDAHGDVNIQEAIRLHESGDLSRSTAMFGQLADPEGANNALAQVLYGLALRHGWGIATAPAKAVFYLSHAAANSAAVEEQALAAGMKKGGAAKGELVLAIFELANCFRHAWGVEKDPVAARQYYETAANLGDSDAMEEAAWCYVEGFGGAKDKVSLFCGRGSTERNYETAR